MGVLKLKEPKISDRNQEPTVNDCDATNVASISTEDHNLLTDEALVSCCEAVFTDLRTNLRYLRRLRERFREAKGQPICGYANWTEFVKKNSGGYSLRTIQRALNGEKQKKAKINTHAPEEALGTVLQQATDAEELTKPVAAITLLECRPVEKEPIEDGPDEHTDATRFLMSYYDGIISKLKTLARQLRKQLRETDESLKIYKKTRQALER